MKWFADRGHAVTGLDRSPEAIQMASRFGDAVLADIENGPWPLMENGQARQFEAVIVTNYLWRPLFPVMAQSLAPGGVLIYETFAQGNETVASRQGLIFFWRQPSCWWRSSNCTSSPLKKDLLKIHPALCNGSQRYDLRDGLSPALHQSVTRSS